MFKNYIFVCASILLLQFDNSFSEKKTLDVAKLVESVNKIKYLPWKADTYTDSKVDVNSLAKTRLGVKLDRKYEPVYKNSNPRKEMKKATLKPSDTDYMNLPANFTWANKTITKCPIDKIRDQSNCGSCWAVATASVLGDRYCIRSKGNNTVPLSHEFIVGCEKDNFGCSGGYMSRVNNFMVINGTITGGEYESDQGCQQYSIRPCGFPQTAAMPCEYYYSSDPKCKQRKCNNDWYSYQSEPDSNVFKADSWTFVESNYTHSREDRIREEIYRNGPVTAVFYVLTDFMYYKKGVYVPKPRSWYAGGHAVRVVGWGIENGLKYWHAANSWGPYWGEDGFFKFIRGVNMCSFESGMTAFYLPSSNSTA